MRYGLEGELLDFGVEQSLPAPELIRELLAHVEPYAVRLNVTDELAHVHTILAHGASAERQVRVWRESGEDLRAVVDSIVAETENIA